MEQLVSSGSGPKGPGQNKKKLRAQALKQKKVDKPASNIYKYGKL
jgi:hypothetical protein